MTIKINRIIYILYSVLVYLIYLLSTGILPPDIKWMTNKFWYLTTFVLSALILYKIRAKIDKQGFIPLFALTLYVALSFISYFLTLDISNAIVKILPNITYLLSFFIIVILVRLYPLARLIRPFIISSLWIIFLSLIKYFGYDIPIYGGEEVTHGTAIDYVNAQAFGGIFINKNTFGGTLVVSIVSFYIGITLIKGYSLYRFLLYLFIFIASILLITTLSRASIFTILIIGFLFTIKNISNRSGFYIFIAAVLSMFSLYSYFYSYINKFLDRVESDGSSSRTLIWEDALNTFYSNPLTGVGDYRFITHYGKEFVTHNSYLGQLVNLGIFPSIFWFIWITYGLMYSYKYIFSLKKTQKINALLSAYFIGVLVYNFVEDALPSSTFPMTLLFMIVFCYNIYVPTINYYKK